MARSENRTVLDSIRSHDDSRKKTKTKCRLVGLKASRVRSRLLTHVSIEHCKQEILVAQLLSMGRTSASTAELSSSGIRAPALE
jgi:hypothetical protein